MRPLPTAAILHPAQKADKKNRLFIRNVLFTFSTELFIVGISFLNGILLARMLSPNDRGVLALVMSLPFIFYNMLNLGLNESVVYFIGRRKLPTSAVTIVGLSMALLIGLAALFGLNAFRAPVMATFLKGMPAGPWPLVIALIPLTLIEGIFSSTLRAVQSFARLNLLRLLLNGLMLIGVVSLFAAGLGTLENSIYAFGFSILLALPVGLAMIWRYLDTAQPGSPALAKAMFGYGIKSHMRNMLEGLNTRMDIYLMALFLAPDQIAFYSVAFSMAEIAWYLPNSVGMVLFPRLANASLDEVHTITAQVYRATMALTALIAVGVMLLSLPVLPLFYGAAYRASYLPLLVLLPGIIWMGGYKVLARDFASRDRQQITILAALAAFILIAGLDLLLIPLWGTLGAALASTTGYTAAGLILLVFFIRESGIPARTVLLIQPDELRVYWGMVLGRLKERRKAEQP